MWCLAFATGLGAFFSWHTVLLVVDSWEFDEVSYGMIPVPLWIPQTSMAVGLIVLTIALIDDLVGVIRGQEASYESADESLLSTDSEKIPGE